jgi:hypothetical protein
MAGTVALTVELLNAQFLQMFCLFGDAVCKRLAVQSNPSSYKTSFYTTQEVSRILCLTRGTKYSPEAHNIFVSTQSGHNR